MVPDTVVPFMGLSMYTDGGVPCTVTVTEALPLSGLSASESVAVNVMV
jgi:hypothetical protein